MKKLIYVVTIGLGIFLGITVSSSKTPSVVHTSTVESTQTPTISVEKHLDKPVTLRIPKLGIDTAIESVTEDSTGAMDVPKEAANVGWYSLGVMPGGKGNAVIAGHLDTPTGEGAVFYKLSSLTPGDEIQVLDEKNNLLTFIVEKKETYQTDTFPIQTVFGSNQSKMLNLITCEGNFNQSKKLYSQRLVVFSKLKE